MTLWVIMRVHTKRFLTHDSEPHSLEAFAVWVPCRLKFLMDVSQHTLTRPYWTGLSLYFGAFKENCFCPKCTVYMMMMMMMTIIIIIITAKLDEMEEAAHQLFTVMQSQQQKLATSTSTWSALWSSIFYLSCVLMAPFGTFHITSLCYPKTPLVVCEL